jgi:hypothetical protein
MMRARSAVVVWVEVVISGMVIFEFVKGIALVVREA